MSKMYKRKKKVRDHNCKMPREMEQRCIRDCVLPMASWGLGVRVGAPATADSVGGLAAEKLHRGALQALKVEGSGC